MARTQSVFLPKYHNFLPQKNEDVNVSVLSEA